jgi:hypothetical protein
MTVFNRATSAKSSSRKAAKRSTNIEARLLSLSAASMRPRKTSSVLRAFDRVSRSRLRRLPSTPGLLPASASALSSTMRNDLLSPTSARMAARCMS